MTDTEFRDALARLRLPQKVFAAMIRRDTETVSRWARGERPVPGFVDLVIELLQHREEMIAKAREAAE